MVTTVADAHFSVVGKLGSLGKSEFEMGARVGSCLWVEGMGMLERENERENFELVEEGGTQLELKELML